MRGSGGKFSVVLPVHNEEQLLPLTIRSNYLVNPSEVLFGVDRCTDGTEKIIKRAAELYPDIATRIIRYGDGDGIGWRFRSAFLRRDLYRRAENDVIMNTSADLNLDPRINEYVKQIPKPYALVSFHYYENPWTIQCFERVIINKFLNGFAGLLAVSREAWLNSEDIEELKQLERGEDTHLKLAILRKYQTKHFHTYSLHLRPNEATEDHYNRGLAIYAQLRHSPFRVFIHSIILLRPAVLTGFMHARSLDKGRKRFDNL